MTSMAKDKFFNRRRKGLDGKAMDMVLGSIEHGNDIQVAIIYKHGNDHSYFTSHPHLDEAWPPSVKELKEYAIRTTSMETCDQKKGQRKLMAEWKRKNGLTRGSADDAGGFGSTPDLEPESLFVPDMFDPEHHQMGNPDEPKAHSPSEHAATDDDDGDDDDDDDDEEITVSDDENNSTTDDDENFSAIARRKNARKTTPNHADVGATDGSRKSPKRRRVDHNSQYVPVESMPMWNNAATFHGLTHLSYGGPQSDTPQIYPAPTGTAPMIQQTPYNNSQAPYFNSMGQTTAQPQPDMQGFHGGNGMYGSGFISGAPQQGVSTNMAQNGVSNGTLRTTRSMVLTERPKVPQSKSKIFRRRSDERVKHATGQENKKKKKSYSRCE